MNRRDVLRLLALTSLAGAAVPALAACSGSSPGGPGTGSGLTLVSSDLDRSDGLSEAIPDVVAAMRGLAGDLYGQLVGTPGNLALSPYSIAVALGMTLNGAVGETADEMRSTLRLDGPVALETDRFNGGLNALTRAVEALAGPVKRPGRKDDEIALDAANTLFGERTTTWRSEFLDVLAREYGAGLESVDFIGATEAARGLINDWTAEKTHDKIPQIIPEGVLDALTRLVLVNALYLKAPWQTPFEKAMTAAAPFHLGDGSTVDVPMMRGPVHGGVLRDGAGWRALSVPYAGSTLAMTVVLPSGHALAAVEAFVVGGGLATILGEGKRGDVALRLPLWTFRSTSPLKEALQGLGMEAAFTEGLADFSGMTTDERLHVSAVLHEAFIAVDEDGTEAAAATAVVMAGESAPAPLEPFVVDRPFLFVIHDLEHGTPLFLGRVADPRPA